MREPLREIQLMRASSTSTSLVALALLVGCSASESDTGDALCAGIEGPCAGFHPDTHEDDVLEAFVTAEPGHTLIFGEGAFHFTRELSLDAPDVVIRGQGMNATILDFADQNAGHGIYVEAPGDRFLIEDLSIVDARQNGIEVRNTRGIVFRRIKVEWTADPHAFDPDSVSDGDSVDAAERAPFGRYGIYPTSCNHVLVEDIEVRRASDAGVYVGSCNDAVLRNNYATENVSGLQVENTLRADVYGNTVENNVLGILVHDLPQQPVNANGDQTRVFDNVSRNNNFVNFALQQDFISGFPTGMGIIVLARGNVEIRDNTIEDNQSVNLAMVSYRLLESDFSIANGFYPYPSDVQIHGNSFSGGGDAPELERRGRAIEMGVFLEYLRNQEVFGGRVPDIVYDGIFDPEHVAADPENENPMGICLGASPHDSFANLRIDLADLDAVDLAAMAAGASREVAPFACEGAGPLPPVELDLWEGAGYEP
jgi:parallel beta-helix repeat protein